MIDENPASSQPTFVYVIGRTAQGLRHELQQRLAKWGLSVAEFTALSILQNRPGLSNAQLARRSLVTPQSMHLVVAELERRQLLERKTRSDHGRILRAEVTARGRDLLEAVAPTVTELEAELLASVSAEDRQTALDALMRSMETLTVIRRDQAAGDARAGSSDR